MYDLDQFSKIVGANKSTIRTYDEYLKPYRTPGGHRRYDDSHVAKFFKLNVQTTKVDTVVYCRVSSSSQEKDLTNQVDLCISFCAAKGFKVDEIIEDIGSSINFNRKGLKKLLTILINRKPKRLVIASKDRLARIGFDLFQKLCEILDVDLIIINDSLHADNYDPIKQVAEELVHIIQLYAMKIYGHRKYSKIKNCVLESIKNETSPSNKS